MLARKLTAAERTAVARVFRRRILDRVPAAYLTREAFLGEHRFYVDERVIIPRSYFLEIIPQLGRWLKKSTAVTRAADVCTGSGCLAILLAHQFPQARVDAIDLAPGALAVAKINVPRTRPGRPRGACTAAISSPACRRPATRSSSATRPTSRPPS